MAVTTSAPPAATTATAAVRLAPRPRLEVRLHRLLRQLRLARSPTAPRPALQAQHQSVAVTLAMARTLTVMATEWAVSRSQRGWLIGLVTVCAIGAPTWAQEARWKFIGVADSDSVISIDTKTLSRPYAGYVTVWVQALRTPKARPTFQGTPESKTIQRFRINCPGMAMGSLALVSYDADGNVLESFNDPNPTYNPIIPDSIGEMIYGAVCIDGPAPAG